MICDESITATVGAAGLWPLMVAMFLTGLAGGFGHCTAMCGPFVMAQVAGGIAGRRPGPGGLAAAGAAGGMTVLARAGAGILLPYHLGRLTTYAALGAVVGGVSGMVVLMTDVKPLLGAVLLLAALLFLVQALAGAARWVPALAVVKGVADAGWAGRLGQALARPLRPLFARPGGVNGYLLGVALGFLPCGFLYAALASAAGTGAALGGFAVMGAFALGTMPSLVTVGVLGSVAGSRWAGVMRAAAPLLMLFNAGLIGWMALGVLGAR